MSAATAAPPVVADTGEALRAGRAPVGTGASPLFAQLLALGLVALGVVAVRDLLVDLGVLSGASWLASWVEAADGLTGDAPLTAVVGAVAVLAGLLLLPVALRRRPRTGVALTAATGVHLRRRDLGRIAAELLADADTVTDLKVRLRRRRVRVRATTLAGRDRDAALGAELRERVETGFAALERRPRVSVKLRHEEAR